MNEAETRRAHIDSRFTDRQRVFLDLVLSHYVSVGVDELDQEKLTPLLRLKYHDSIADAAISPTLTATSSSPKVLPTASRRLRE